VLFHGTKKEAGSGSEPFLAETEAFEVLSP
jgi:hypothetical protein